MMTVLIVEDDVVLLDVYRRKLESAAMRVITAADGPAGFKLAEQIRPDLILLDIGLPIKDGLTVLADLRKTTWGESMPVIILTGLDPTDAMLSSVVSGHPAYYLIKGMSRPEDVLIKVQEVLSNGKNTLG